MNGTSKKKKTFGFQNPREGYSNEGKQKRNRIWTSKFCGDKPGGSAIDGFYDKVLLYFILC